MGKHTNPGADATPAAADPAATDTTTVDETTTSSGQQTTSSGGKMRPNPYWGPHDDKT